MSVINDKNLAMSSAVKIPIKVVEGRTGTDIGAGGQVVVVLGDKFYIYDDSYSKTKPVEVKSSITVRGYIGAKQINFHRIILGKGGITAFKRWQLNRYVKSTLQLLSAGDGAPRPVVVEPQDNQD